jgi:hypothetical protein
MLDDNIINEIGEKFPIKLKYIEKLINKTHAKYPALSKIEVIFIVKAFFECLRDELLIGNLVSINGFLSGMHLISFTRQNKDKQYRVIKVKAKTPRKIRYV